MGKNPQFRVSLVVCLTALLIIGYSFSLEQRRMIGDEVGHDPGSRALPLIAGIVMLIAGAYDGFHEWKAFSKRASPASLRSPLEHSDAAQTSKEKNRSLNTTKSFFWLFILTLVGSILYISLLEKIGFILLTTLFLYTLFFFFLRAYARTNLYLGSLLGGLSVALSFSALLYTAGRLISRELFYWGRSGGYFFFASRTGTVLIFILIAIGLFIIGLGIARRFRLKNPGDLQTINSILLASGTSLFLFIVFKMVFRVNLPGGLLSF